MPTTSEIIRSALAEELYAKAESRRGESVKLIRRLERADGHNAARHRLARRLRRCSPKHRCGSPACPQCGAAEQALQVSMTKKFIAENAESSRRCLCFDHTFSLRVPKGGFKDFDAANFKRRLRDGLAMTTAPGRSARSTCP